VTASSISSSSASVRRSSATTWLAAPASRSSSAWTERWRLSSAHRGHVEQAVLETTQLVVKVSMGFRAHPNLPVRYASVRSSRGRVKSCSVLPYSTNWAQVEKRGEIRHPGGLLEVVGHDDNGILGLELHQQLSTRCVAIGSSAEQGSSSSSTCGSFGERAGDAQPLLLAAR